MHKLLIANRGEIALRVIRAAQDYGLKTVAIYAEDELDALHTQAADEAYSLGAGGLKQTYLNAEKILEIAARAGADALHPGYGFLSERADFAQSVLDAGLIWVGPPPQVIATLGDKLAARALAQAVGAPLAQGSGLLNSAQEAEVFARETGLPVMIKAAHGGGGRGMRVAETLAEVAPLFEAATREAEQAFGLGACYIEQFLQRPRHIEAQILADSHGETRVLGLRDCSLQRRNQKLVEEAPAPHLPPEIAARVEQAARDICAKAGYIGAGTVEFLLSEQGVLSFLEVNTRLQVEHPVTEEVSGVDIVVEQLRIADGLPLSPLPAPRGHAIEFRITAEDAGRGFLPSPGKITRFSPPAGAGVRLETGVAEGSIVSQAYDGLIAKLIVSAPSRAMALARARRALAEFVIEGVATTLPLHRALLEEPDFTGDVFNLHTHWIETVWQGLPPAPRAAPAEANLIRSVIEIDGKRHQIALPAGLFAQNALAPQPTEIQEDLIAPLTGTLLSWLVEDGTEVAEGQPVAVIEAMKSETTLTAPRAGRLRMAIAAGQSIASGTTLATFDRSPA